MAAVLLAAAGCVSLRPFAEVRSAQPSGSYVTVDGHAVYVEQAGPREAETVLLLHGFGASSYSWRQVVPALARSYHVLALDLFGFGWSERPQDPWCYTREGQERMILGVLDSLGIARAHFVGHSYGGGLTLFVASRHPERLLSMVLLDSSAPTYGEDRRTRLANIRPLDSLAIHFALRRAHVRRSLLGSIGDPALVTPELVTAYVERLRVEGEATAFFGLTGVLQRPPGSPPPPAKVQLETLRTPTLVVWGEADRVIPIADGQAAARRLPDGAFAAIPGAGHLAMEDHPAELLRLMLPFLDAHRVAPHAADAPAAARSAPAAAGADQGAGAARRDPAR